VDEVAHVLADRYGSRLSQGALVAAGPAELTLQNNRAVVTVSGVRDRLRVLLVSGEPHAGERVWRNLLKADPSVDLVHFTILRPPDKQDATPINELSLIAFPSRELFQEKLRSFDLVVFDRYSERGVLPLVYFQNLASYVQDGGALLVSSGPEFAGIESIYRTPLSQVLPVQPTGQIVTQPFKPNLTPDGLAHPVTRELPGRNQEKAAPSWGPWFRILGANKVSGQTVMAGGGGKTTACTICHGDGMKGLANVPRIAGLHPIYVARQLHLFKDGGRAGADAALMKKPVMQLTDEDILNISAYVGSLSPE